MEAIAPQIDTTDSLGPNPAGTRSSVLAAARRVAERDGILDLSLLSVAQEADVAPGSVYSCFNSKNDLLLSVIADDLGTLAHAMRGAFGTGNEDAGLSARPISSLPALLPVAVETIATAHGATPASRPPEQTETFAGRTTADGSDMQISAAEGLNTGGAVEAIAKLQETVARFETRPVDSWLERRLREFERALSALESQRSGGRVAESSVEERFRELNEEIGSLEHRLQTAAEDAARSLAQRIVACENSLRDVAVDKHADATTRVATLETASLAVKPEFPVAAAGTQETETAMDHSDPESASAEPGASVSSYLAAARKSAQAAAVTQDTRVRRSGKGKSQTTVYLAMGGLFLFVALLTAAGLLLRNNAMDNASVQDRFHSGVVTSPPTGSASSRPGMNPQRRLRTLAEAGDPRAELLIGQEYLDGSGAAKNDVAAFAWLSRAAARDQPIAQYELGVMYQTGRGASTDAVQAFRWFEAAALKGNRRAMHSLATAYAEGWGTEKTLFESARWYGRAAQLGSINDQFNLGVLFERGMGVAQSLPDAYKWYAVAAAQGDKESQSRIAAIAPMLAPDDLAAAQSAAQSFKPDAPSTLANTLPALAEKR